MSPDSNLLTSIEWEVAKCLSEAHLSACLLEDSLSIDDTDTSVGEWKHDGGIVIALPRTSEQEYYWSDCVVSVSDVR